LQGRATPASASLLSLACSADSFQDSGFFFFFFFFFINLQPLKK